MLLATTACDRDWSDLPIFLEVARARQIGRAASALGLDATDDILELVAANIAGGIREWGAALARLAKYVSSTKKDLTAALAREVLGCQ